MLDQILDLHDDARHGSAQFMGSIVSKLFLLFVGRINPVHHVVKCMSKFIDLVIIPLLFEPDMKPLLRDIGDPFLDLL